MAPFFFMHRYREIAMRTVRMFVFGYGLFVGLAWIIALIVSGRRTRGRTDRIPTAAVHALDDGVSFVKLPFAGHADVDHGAVVARTDDHRVAGGQLGLEPGD